MLEPVLKLMKLLSISPVSPSPLLPVIVIQRIRGDKSVEDLAQIVQ